MLINALLGLLHSNNNSSSNTISDVHQKGEIPYELEILRKAVEATIDSIVITSVSGEIQWVNPSFTQLTGYTADEALGKNPRILKSGKQDDAFYAQMWETISHGRVWSGRVTNKRKDGTFYEEKMSITPVLQEKNITHFIAIKHDITNETEMNDLLRQREEQYRLIVESSPELIMTLSQEGLIQSVNQRITVLLGYSPDEIIGQNIQHVPFFSPESGEIVLQNCKKRFAGEDIPTYELQTLTKNGETKFMKIRGNIIHDSQNIPFLDLLIVTDITAEKKREKEELRRIQQMEELNKMMVDREIKMVELKKRIEQLEKERSQ